MNYKVTYFNKYITSLSIDNIKNIFVENFCKWPLRLETHLCCSNSIYTCIYIYIYIYIYCVYYACFYNILL